MPQVDEMRRSCSQHSNHIPCAAKSLLELIPKSVSLISRISSMSKVTVGLLWTSTRVRIFVQDKKHTN